MAAATLRRGETAQARALLTELQRLQPQRPETGELLSRIAAAAP
jgi:hypothetical protein